MGQINDLVKQIHKLATEKGWWDSPRSTPECIALMHSELSEALEEYRNDKPAIYQNINEYYSVYSTPENPSWDATKKPEGELVELADTVIRIMDYCGAKGYDLEQAINLKNEYNKTRGYRHGGKKA